MIRRAKLAMSQETAALKRYAQESWGVATLPSFVFIKSGKVLNRLGKADEQEFLALLADSKKGAAGAEAEVAACTKATLSASEWACPSLKARHVIIKGDFAAVQRWWSSCCLSGGQARAQAH